MEITAEEYKGNFDDFFTNHMAGAFMEAIEWVKANPNVRTATPIESARMKVVKAMKENRSRCIEVVGEIKRLNHGINECRRKAADNERLAKENPAAGDAYRELLSEAITKIAEMKTEKIELIRKVRRFDVITKGYRNLLMDDYEPCNI